MELVLIISLVIMYFITKAYNKNFHFESFKIELLVQLLHIIVIFVILIPLVTNQYIAMKLLSFIGFYLLGKNITCLLQILFYYLHPDEKTDEDNNDDGSEER